MIRVGDIQAAMKLVAGYAGITFVRAEQNGPRPALPFMEYKITSQPQDPDHTESAVSADDPDDETATIITSERSHRAVVSLSVYGSDYRDIWSYAELMRDYLESETGKEALFALGLFPRILSPETNDRTSYLETSYEYRVGFDAAFDGIKTRTESVPAVDLESTVGSLAL
jgi:hypothetical protein